MKYFSLSFDLEEFDMPKEFGTNIGTKEMLNVSFEGAKKISELIQEQDITATFFITTNFLQAYPRIIKSLSKTHEIACHGEHDKCYSNFSSKDMVRSIKQNKSSLEKITNKRVKGFRSPRMMTPDYALLKKLGFEYDASLHPTYVPGRYNNIFEPRTMFKKYGLNIIPTSVTPITRFPMTWFWFRNLGLKYVKACTRMCFLTDPYVNIYFHPWEFISLGGYNIPPVFKRNTGESIYRNLKKYVMWLKGKGVRFITMDEISKTVFET